MVKFSPIESEFETSEMAEEHDAWVREKVRKAMASTAPLIPHDEVMREMDSIIAKARDAR